MIALNIQYLIHKLTLTAIKKLQFRQIVTVFFMYNSSNFLQTPIHSLKTPVLANDLLLPCNLIWYNNCLDVMYLERNTFISWGNNQRTTYIHFKYVQIDLFYLHSFVCLWNSISTHYTKKYLIKWRKAFFSVFHFNGFRCTSYKVLEICTNNNIVLQKLQVTMYNPNIRAVIYITVVFLIGTEVCRYLI